MGFNEVGNTFYSLYSLWCHIRATIQAGSLNLMFIELCRRIIGELFLMLLAGLTRSAWLSCLCNLGHFKHPAQSIMMSVTSCSHSLSWQPLHLWKYTYHDNESLRPTSLSESLAQLSSCPQPYRSRARHSRTHNLLSEHASHKCTAWTSHGLFMHWVCLLFLVLPLRY